MSIYTVGVKFDQVTKMYSVVEPSGIEMEAATLDEIIVALPELAQAAYNLPPGSATGLELFVHIPPDPEALGPTGVTGPSGPSGTSGASGATGGAMSSRLTRSQLNDMTKEELLEVAEKSGVNVSQHWNKADIVDTIVRHKGPTGL